MSTNKLGGYSAFTPYKEAEKEVQAYFLEVTKQLVGVNFTPLAVAQQVVNGINFAYFTTAKGTYSEARYYNALVIVHVATTGAVTLTEVKPVQPVKGSGEGLAGGYTAFLPIDDSPIPAILLEKVGAGVSYTPLAIASQVVAGVNYAIFAEAKIVYPEAVPYNVILTLFRDLEGAYYLTHIERVEII
ncbi:MAG: hypothetical protein LBF67_04925 [Prevotellaceae bacterium]|jgi:hypothetical protein|nr:hypothetical protein [Prevotellaceae bacterium]